MMKVASAMILAAGVAQAQSAPCAPRGDMVAELGAKYGETRHGAGIAGRTAVVEVFVSDETGPWTIIFTRPDGVSCRMAAGEAWLDERPPVGDPS